MSEHQETKRTAGALASARCLLVWWALLFVLYLVFVSSVDPTEVALGGGAALLGAVGAEAVRRAEHPRTGGLRTLAPAAAAFPGTLLRETGALAVAVVRQLRGRQGPGRIVRLALRSGTSAAGAAALLSASPGACVIDIQDSGASGQETDTGAELTLHLLDDRVSRIERTLPGRRPG